MDESYVCQSTCAILCLRRTVSLLVVNIPTIKVSKCYWFQGSFSSGFDNFSPAGLFQKLAKPCEGVWPCIDGFVYDFRVLWGGMTAKCLMATFCLAKMKEKTYMFNEKKCHRSGYFSHIENFSCEQCKVPFWISNIEYRSVQQSSCGPLRNQPSHPRESTSGSPKVSITKEYLHFFLKTIGISP